MCAARRHRAPAPPQRDLGHLAPGGGVHGGHGARGAPVGRGAVDEPAPRRPDHGAGHRLQELALYRWAREATPIDALFVAPPSLSLFFRVSPQSPIPPCWVASPGRVPSSSGFHRFHRSYGLLRLLVGHRLDLAILVGAVAVAVRTGRGWMQLGYFVFLIPPDQSLTCRTFFRVAVEYTTSTPFSPKWYESSALP